MKLPLLQQKKRKQIKTKLLVHQIGAEGSIYFDDDELSM
jgi:hypothetical protein